MSWGVLGGEAGFAEWTLAGQQLLSGEGEVRFGESEQLDGVER